MAITFKVGICDLLPELLADTLILLTALHSAGAVAACHLEALFQDLYHFLIFVETNSHFSHILPLFIINREQKLSSPEQKYTFLLGRKMI